MSITVRDIEIAISDAYPVERAEAWDRGGLTAGDPSAEVTGVVCALDPTPTAVRRTVELNANVLVTHHPPYLEGVERIGPGRGPAGVLFEALSNGVALINAHTNLDRDPAAQRLLPDAFGLETVGPLERSTQPMARVTAYVPSAYAETVVDAMAQAGAGRVGEYERASFSAAGTGSFEPRSEANPFVGVAGERAEAAETRVEMVCPPALADTVAAAAAQVHPYEEPLVVVDRVAIARNAAALGMRCKTPRDMTLSGLAVICGSTFSITPRIWGDPDTRLKEVVTATGSASSLVGAALASGAQAMVCGEVRYHDALDAVENGLALIELGHDVSEWPLVSLLERAVRRVPGLPAVSVHVLPARPGWWTT